MKVLAFRHVPFEGIGRIAPLLEERGIACDYADLYRQGAVAPDIAAYNGLIFMGGPMSANDPLPYLDEERALIRQAAERRQPMLGVCLGSQLIARSLGGAVDRNRAKRRLREVFRKHQQEIPAGFDLLLIARTAIKRSSFAELEQRFLAAVKWIAGAKAAATANRSASAPGGRAPP